jgi:cyanophycin synthetase
MAGGVRVMLMDDFALFARKLGYGVTSYNCGEKVYKISKDGKSFLTFGKSFPLNSVVASNLAKYKDLTKQILKDAGFLVPNGFITSGFAEVEEAIKNGKLKFPLVVKPDTASLGKLVAALINDMDDLKVSFDRVLDKYGKVLVEEYYEGDDYRFLVLDGEVLAVAHRIPPFVVGDGISSVSDLIDDYKVRRGFSHLKVGFEVNRMLAKQNLTTDSIPGKGVRVMLRANANVSTGGMVEDVTDVVSDYFKKIAVRATKALGLRFCGLDILSRDIVSSKSDYRIIELNAAPHYDLHWEVEIGKKRDVRGKILKLLLG